MHLHPLSLQEPEDVALAGRTDVQPDAGHQIGEGAAPGNVGASADVRPLAQHLERTHSQRRSVSSFPLMVHVWDVHAALYGTRLVAADGDGRQQAMAAVRGSAGSRRQKGRQQKSGVPHGPARSLRFLVCWSCCLTTRGSNRAVGLWPVGELIPSV